MLQREVFRSATHHNVRLLNGQDATVRGCLLGSMSQYDAAYGAACHSMIKKVCCCAVCMHGRSEKDSPSHSSVGAQSALAPTWQGWAAGQLAVSLALWSL